MQAKPIFQALLVIAAVGVPGFLPFDSSGLTQHFGLLNAQSYTRIALSLTVGYVFVSLLALSKAQRIKSGGGNSFSLDPDGFLLLFLLYGIFLLSLIKAGGKTDFLLGLYRACEWMLAIGLCSAALGAFGNTQERHGPSDTFFRLVKYITTIPVVIVLIGVVVAPDWALSQGGVRRLGGNLYQPNTLGLLAGIGAFMFWFHRPSLKSRIWAAVLITVMVLTYSRGAMIGFVLSIVVICITHRKRQVKILGLMAVPASILVALAFSDVLYDQIEPLLTRGQALKDVGTLNSRTEVWVAAWRGILDSPLIGHGYIFGPKDLPDYMYNKPWWAPPHAHNDIVNAGFAGGIGAAVLAAVIFIGVGYRLVTMDRSASEKVPMVAVYIQLTVYAMLTPLLSSSFKAQGIIFLLLMRYLAVTAPKQIRIGEMHRKIKNTPFNFS